MGERVRRELQRPLARRAAQWRDLLHAARSPDRHRKLETALQCRSSARLDRLPRSSPGGVRPSTRRMAGCATPTSSAGHAPAGATANAKLRFKSDHQAGAGHLNLGYRWFCRLGLEGGVPDHSTFSKNRHGRFRESDLLRELFEMTVQRCMTEGLVDGEGFAADASLIKADANKQRSVEGSEEVDWEAMAATRRSVREYLDTLDEAAWGAASEVRPKFV